MLSHLSEQVLLPDGSTVLIGGEELMHKGLELHCSAYLREFRLDAGLPVWQFDIQGVLLEKRILMPYRQNTVYVTYRILDGKKEILLQLRPSIGFRRHGDPVEESFPGDYSVEACGDRFEISAGPRFPGLKAKILGRNSAFRLDGGRKLEFFYRHEAQRGRKPTCFLWSPGHFSALLERGQEASLIASTEPWEIITALSPSQVAESERERRRALLDGKGRSVLHGIAPELVLATDTFVISPAARNADIARFHALGEEAFTVVAGYHWFSDWGRDAMIALEGLTLLTGRYREASSVLRTFLQRVQYGLIPVYFSEKKGEWGYSAADATLWLFHALDRYVAITGDKRLLRTFLPTLREIIRLHLSGTRFGIGADPQDGLLRQGDSGYPLTWMDARVDDWIVTPRRGKAVEINALWFNALRLLSGWVKEEEDFGSADSLEEQARRVYESFNRKFWYQKGEYLFDVIEGERGEESAFRPNQVFSISLAHPVLDPDRWGTVLKKVKDLLLTPVGLRSLSHDHPDFKSKYFGDRRALNAAYHQGTVWAWLIGPFIDAWLRVYPEDKRGARGFLEGFIPHLDEAGLGTVSSVFDAVAPFTPRGCISHACSVAEVLRSWARTEG
jgi:predicted glycogen debranching enzyme